MKKLLLITFLFSSLYTFAQDWAPFKTTDSLRHYVGLNVNSPSGFQINKPIQSISVDSLFSDSLGLTLSFEKGFSLNNLYNPNSGFYEDIIKGRILGDKLKFYNDSLVVTTLDSFGFTLNFPFIYSIGQTFNFAKSINHNVTGVCDSIYIDSINNQIDSIARISLTVYHKNGTLDSIHHFNCNFLISKNFGLALTPDFTNLDSLYYFEPFFNLKDQLKCNKTLDLNIGDEFHYTIDTNNYVTSSGRNVFYSHYGYKVTVLADSLAGSIVNKRLDETFGSGFPGSYSNSNNGKRILNLTYNNIGQCHQAKSAIINDSLLEFRQQGTYIPIDIYGIDDSKPVFKLFKNKVYSNDIINYSPQNWPPVVDSAYYAPFYSSYNKALIGLTDEYYYNGFGGVGTSSLSKRLVYFKKGNQIWGTPINLTVGLNENFTESFFRFYPNPVRNQLNIVGNLEIEQAEIFNLQGKEIKEFKNKNMLEISELKAGIYFIRMITAEGIFTQKFVKE